jgi:hypothetical protein
MSPGFLDPELVPEYLHSEVRAANVCFASYNEISELLSELATDPEVPIEQFTRLLASQKLAYEAYAKRATVIFQHLQNESAIIRERLGLDDTDFAN